MADSVDSSPSVMLDVTEAQTPQPDVPDIRHMLSFHDARIQGPFERGAAEGTHASHAVAFKDATNSATWDIRLVRDSTVYLWLRFLARGPALRDGPHREIRHSIPVVVNGEHRATLGGGERLDIAAPDEMLEPGSEIAGLLCTWQRPGTADLEGIELPAGEHELTLRNLPADVHYDQLWITSDPPSYSPTAGSWARTDPHQRTTHECFPQGRCA